MPFIPTNDPQRCARVLVVATMGDVRVSETVFACHSRVCAPPPTGSGGSRGSMAGGKAPRGRIKSNVSAWRNGGWKPVKGKKTLKVPQSKTVGDYLRQQGKRYNYPNDI